MFREIKKKLLILENRRPWPLHTAAYIDESNQADWIYTALRYDDPTLTRENVLRISKGEFVAEVAVSQHIAVENQRSVLHLAWELTAAGQKPSQHLVERLLAALAPEQRPIYRQDNPILLPLDYNPPHFKEIPEQLALLFQQLATEDFYGNPILKAAWLHNRFLEIYPFSGSNEAAARNLMFYQLLLEGYPPFSLELSEQEYYTAIRQYLQKKAIAPLYDAMERSLYNKAEVLLQLTVGQP